MKRTGRTRSTCSPPWPRAGALRRASAALKNDKKVVLVAVAQDGGALRHTSAALRNDKEVVLAAVAQGGHALQDAPAALEAPPPLQRAAGAAGGSERAAVCADPATVWAVEVESQAIATLAGNLNFQNYCFIRPPKISKESSQRLAAAAERVAGSQAAPLGVVDVGGNECPLAAPGWWSVPGGDLVVQALAQHPALVEANQRFELVTSGGAPAPATVLLLLSGPAPSKATLVWLGDDDDAVPPEAPAAKRPRGEQHKPPGLEV